MINLLQENFEMKSPSKIAHWFLPTRKKADLKKPKELFFAYARLTMRIDI